MSTITKILKTAGVSALCNGVHLYLLKDKYKSIEFTQAAMGAVFTTLPALAGVGIDKFVNQKFTSNKTTQYGLIAIESSLIFPVVTGLSAPNQPLKYFTDLFSPSLKGNCGVSKLLTASTMGQSLAFKYIWDSSYETNPELNTEIEQQVEEMLEIR